MMSSNSSSDSADLTMVSDWQLCPACGGRTALHEETIIRLGVPREVRYRRRCEDPWCGRSLPVPDIESASVRQPGGDG
jgi:hypothetical protein